MNKKYKTCISMMSGTSLDGIDACLAKIFDDLSFEIICSHSLEYPKEVQAKLLKTANNEARTDDVCFLNFVVGELFAKCANELIQKSHLKNYNIDFISSHGQTIFHIPTEKEIGEIKTKSTLQIGDISVISEKTGILTVGDFRTKDIAAGGLGAPLVPFADEILFGKGKNRAIQNIGGISNVTVLSNKVDTFAFDNGPGNMLIDYFMNKLFKLQYDKNGETAAKGKVDKKWLSELLKEDYYSKIPPKTTGRELFNNNYAENIYKTAPENKFDLIATITELTALTIYNSYKDFILPKTDIEEVIIGGGGAYNKTLLNSLQRYFADIKVKTHEDFNIPNKLKEALAFAYLGYFCLNKQPNNLPECTGATKPVIMGKISY